MDRIPAEVEETAPVKPLPEGVRAIVRYHEGRRPVGRSGQLRFPRVILVARNPASDLSLPTHLDRSDLVWVLERPSRTWDTVRRRWGGRTDDIVDELIRCGIITKDVHVDENHLRLKDPIKIRLTEVWAAVSKDKRRELLGRDDPAQIRLDLLDMLKDVEELRGEYELLLQQENASVPPKSATGTAHWQTYEFVLRAARQWWTRENKDRLPLRRELLSISHGDSRGTKEDWSRAREQAFENLFDEYITELVEVPDHEIRVKGPLIWHKNDGKVVDAIKADPWAGLPSKGVQTVGRLELVDPVGVFILENSDTFHRVCQIPEIVDRWICVWGSGYTSPDLMGFLKMLPSLPVAVWGDIDAHGIEIIVNLREGVSTEVHPVAMTAQAWLKGPHRRKLKPGRRDEDARKASRLVNRVPGELRQVTELIAGHPELAGLGLEQQAQHDDVLPGLPGLLARVLDSVQQRTP
ncbi:Wadjet anti-phage system protein JetD domain-containing protein [Nocardiopsis alba]|uniref:Wadjet anti-phage system protein JetD domain-containing protein n=1 Tax=Nocardiopsis alba TaxID=53437 RepID=UPI00340BFA63